MRQHRLFMIVAAIVFHVVRTSSAYAAEPPELGGLDVLYPALERLYIDLHRNPELSLREEKTASKMAAELRSAGFEVTEGVGGFGVVGVLRNGDGPTVMLRTDMDALPVKEQTELAYASTAVAVSESGESVPVMHACGHDVHMAAWVGAANLLARSKDRWRGTLVLVGQPAEEIVQGAFVGPRCIIVGVSSCVTRDLPPPHDRRRRADTPCLRTRRSVQCARGHEAA